MENKQRIFKGGQPRTVESVEQRKEIKRLEEELEFLQDYERALEKDIEVTSQVQTKQNTPSKIDVVLRSAENLVELIQKEQKK